VGSGKSAVGTADSGLAGTDETELGLDALNPVSGVDVLDKSELPAGSTTLARGDGRSSQEVFPNLAKSLVIHLKKGFKSIKDCVDLHGTIFCRTWPQPSPRCPSSYGTSARE